MCENAQYWAEGLSLGKVNRVFDYDGGVTANLEEPAKLPLPCVGSLA